MKDLFEKLIEDLKKYKVYIIVFYVVVIIIGVLWGLFQPRKVDEYKRSVQERTSNLTDKYREKSEEYNEYIDDFEDVEKLETDNDNNANENE